MRIMLLAAAAGLSLAASTAAYADGGDGPAANSFFTELPGSLPRLTCRMFSLCPEPAGTAPASGLVSAEMVEIPLALRFGVVV